MGAAHACCRRRRLPPVSEGTHSPPTQRMPHPSPAMQGHKSTTHSKPAPSTVSATNGAAAAAAAAAPAASTPPAVVVPVDNTPVVAPPGEMQELHRVIAAAKAAQEAYSQYSQEQVRGEGGGWDREGC